MEERQITVDGETHPLEKPFVVVATQNNVGTAGTQLLPYAQMDRFMARLSVGYPDHDAQMALLKDRLSENPLDAVSQVLTREELLAMQAEARAVQTSDALLDYITRLTMASRDHAEIEVGVSPRGALLLCQMAKARAYLLGRDFAVSEDVQAVFEPVCAHRLIPTAKARLSGVCARRHCAQPASKRAEPGLHGVTAMKANRLVYAVWLPAAAALYFFENNTGTRAILAASILVPLISVFCAYRCSREAVYRSTCPPAAKKARRFPAVCPPRRSSFARRTLLFVCAMR